jgi:hypothetical protein
LFLLGYKQGLNRQRFHLAIWRQARLLCPERELGRKCKQLLQRVHTQRYRETFLIDSVGQIRSGSAELLKICEENI